MSLPLIKSKYTAIARAASFGTSSKGNTQIAVTFEIFEPAEFAGLEITWTGTFSEKASERTIESIQHMGWQGDDLSELDNLDAAGCAHFLPEQVQLACEPDTYDGKTSLKVQWVNKLGAGRFAFKEPLTGQGLKAFASQMRGTVRASRQGGSAPAPQPQRTTNGPRPVTYSTTSEGTPHPNAPGSRDDIPFASCAMSDEPSALAAVLR